MAIIQLNAGIAALWTTSYGRVLSLKLLLLVPLFGLAAYNRYKLTPSIAQGDAGAQRSMRRTVAVELFLACMILAVVALWRFTPPPARALVEGESFFTHLYTEKAMANVTIAPARAGPLNITIEPETTDERPLDAMEVSVTLSNPEAGIEPIRRPAPPQPPRAVAIRVRGFIPVGEHGVIECMGRIHVIRRTPRSCR